jgi:hypothetical protein
VRYDFPAAKGSRFQGSPFLVRFMRLSNDRVTPEKSPIGPHSVQSFGDVGTLDLSANDRATISGGARGGLPVTAGFPSASKRSKSVPS